MKDCPRAEQGVRRIMAKRKPKDACGEGTGSLPTRVLIVENDAILALSYEHVLEDAGVAQIEICATTETALAALRRSKPDAVILDVHLDDRDDGWAIAELIASLGPDRPRIVFSTGAPQDIPPHIAEMGCVLEKPYDPEILPGILREHERRGIIGRLRAVLR